MLQRIAEAACPEREAHVVEIGPGRGALTKYLLERTDRLTAIELDPSMVASMVRNFPNEDRLEVVQQDILDSDLSRFAPCVIAGNLPYYISSPIATRVFAATGAWKRAVFLVQKEVALRMAAVQGSRDYGYLSVMTQIHANAKLLFTVPAAAFAPPPKVESAVILLEPKVFDPIYSKRFLEFAGRAFLHKRKMLRNNLAPYYGREIVEAQPEAQLRAEQLSPAQLASLFARLSSAPPMLS